MNTNFETSEPYKAIDKTTSIPLTLLTDKLNQDSVHLIIDGEKVSSREVIQTFSASEVLDNYHKYEPVIDFKPHEIRHLSKIEAFKTLANWLKERQRETLILNLVAKAMCKTRNHWCENEPGTCDCYIVETYHYGTESYRRSSHIQGDYRQCRHFREIKDAIDSVTRDSICFKVHFLDEMKEVDLFIDQTVTMFLNQFDPLRKKNYRILKIKDDEHGRLTLKIEKERKE